MIKIFVLASGRSGTRYLASVFRHNIKRCVSKHEPYPTMFGQPIYWYQEKNFEKIRRLFAIKQWRICHCRADVYLETNNAFLKSFADIALECFPDLKLIHIIRNPLEVAKSQLNRHLWLNKIHLPLRRYYRASDGKKYFRWTLTGNEEIFRATTLNPLTPYQFLVLQWIEIENRAIRFLDTYNKHADCYTLFAPEDLNSSEVLRSMFHFFGLEQKDERIHFPTGWKNENKTPTKVTKEDERQFRQVIDHLPTSWLKIFHDAPYTECEWAKLLTGE